MAHFIIVHIILLDYNYRCIDVMLLLVEVRHTDYLIYFLVA